ncbi:MAG: single-stranded-DNA-specific exonuclease RecJ [Anaerolineales bacterium]
MDHLVVQVLYNRGLTRPEEVEAFLAGTVVCDNPFDLEGVDAAVTLIRQILRRAEPIVVYGDYDVDGVTATAVLVQTLRAFGGRAEPYIPDRIEEGYGLNTEAIRWLAEEGARLLITVDCGIRSHDEIREAHERGMKVIVTDHHHIGESLPFYASAVLNPRRSGCRYPFHDLSGVGVAFKLAQALLRADGRVPLRRREEGQKGGILEEELLDLVALGTIADMVPLLGENHVLVRRGLKRINESPRPGLQALMEVSRVEPGQVTARDVSFSLAPRLNAAGRVGQALKALELLLAPDLERARPLARELDNMNLERRDLTRRVREQARMMVLETEEDPPLLFAASPDFPAGIVGLAAGRLMEEFYRPAIVVEMGEEFCKGSARSIPAFHITEALDKVASLLERYGGHAAAAGFTVRREKLSELRDALVELARRDLVDVVLAPVISVDAEVQLSMLSWDRYRALEALAPFGYGNHAPLLVSRHAEVHEARAVGAEGHHLKLYLRDDRGHMWSAIAFRQGEWINRLPPYIDLVYHLERNDWNGRTSLQLNVQDIHPCS